MTGLKRHPYGEYLKNIIVLVNSGNKEAGRPNRYRYLCIIMPAIGKGRILHYPIGIGRKQACVCAATTNLICAKSSAEMR